MDDRSAEIDKCLEILQFLEEKHSGVLFAELRRGILEGDGRCWSDFLEKYSRFIYSNALRQCSDFEDAAGDLPPSQPNGRTGTSGRQGA
ncbi:MAG TPA: hypothetical protein ENG67_00230 [candidate division WOR-3 bacterium]|uniref:Uncharacterized protein n=1 Tax=candidate division WOR-3 bacterium TaxID=2052148 RepID=A0A7C1BEQ1_UNCW3|nr:hypothetical protein [candidate division WOR-3 bacterium]